MNCYRHLLLNAPSLPSVVNRVAWALVISSASLVNSAWADGLTVDKIYDPYVQPLEHELEYRVIHDDTNNLQLHKFGYGQSMSDRWFTEAYLLVQDGEHRRSETEGFELESKWQLTEQGEYNNDWGVMVELEREFSANIWEAATTLIVAHEWSNWWAVANGSVIYEWGSGSQEELETEFNGQIKYRYRRAFEPGWELFLAQDTRATGPVVMGNVRMGGRKGFFWQVGAYAGLDNVTPDTTVKVNLEFEF
ncbi:hypothetical protein [Halioxenophilus sp. WMMB6]|uniref:hypothetical protein n=1 Tax=Halioxenophilus sp. WMMB6 TaxID=3073815 RepID=UPI00295EF903|nr:hypothetical protein [Halioxenophilus sp. WMMB6]